MNTTNLTPAERESINTLGPLMVTTLKALNLRAKDITLGQVEALATVLTRAYLAGKETAWAEGYDDALQDTERASLISAGLRKAHTNPYSKKSTSRKESLS